MSRNIWQALLGVREGGLTPCMSCTSKPSIAASPVIPISEYTNVAGYVCFCILVETSKSLTCIELEKGNITDQKLYDVREQSVAKQAVTY